MPLPPGLPPPVGRMVNEPVGVGAPQFAVEVQWTVEFKVRMGIETEYEVVVVTVGSGIVAEDMVVVLGCTVTVEVDAV